jgi:hypothetical protein
MTAFAPVTPFPEDPTLGRLLLIVLLLVLLGGVAFVVTWDVPPPTKQVETVIPDERLPR